LSAISLEAGIERKAPAGQFRAFEEIESRTSKEVKEYFKKYLECIQLEQSED
jgi:hypothetical protein